MNAHSLISVQTAHAVHRRWHSPPSQSGHGTPAAAGTPSGGQAGGKAADAAQGGPETGESPDSKPVAVIDISGDGDGDNGGQKVSTVISS